MTAPKEIIKLVDRFESHKDQYISGNYNEAQLRQEFLNPFFSALGWDVENRQGHAEPYKEVLHEDAIKIGTATKAPDYAFRIGGTRKFFVEAKNPSVNLKEDISPSYQLRRYAWSAKLPLSILTDFQEFAIYDCRTKPLKTDKASTGRVRYLTYNDYATEWDSIATVFSKEALLKGSFDKFAESTKGKKGTTEVDDAFLKEIESWRDILAKNIALRNAKLSQPELNFAVQRTIDRIIFLRICEDRGIEPYAKLLTLVNGERVYRRLYEQFYRADEKYNSGLFHFEREKDRAERPDELTPNLHIDDKPLKEIIGNLYYPDCPYEFSVLPADILGQVYEQFLGKVIRLTAGHQAKVEEKPEVKKAGGVYYTPTYIVDYIVKNTVGKLLNPETPDADSPKSGRHPERSPERALTLGESKDGVEGSAQKRTKPLTPKEASKLRILDPACGSGSFLIGAYQYLLNWHRDWYEKDGAEKHATGKNAALFRGPGGEWRLTTGERKRILLNNIYGVDIDSQAVEVTKLSLLLKVLEGENEQTISQQLRMFHERALPDLSDNIKCGNSLIGPDFYDGKQLSLLVDQEKNRINVFEWKKEFKEIMDAGGFDAVIGNPPYIQSRSEQFADTEKLYFMEHYRTAEYQLNTFGLFIEKAHSILRISGLFGMIIPNYWLSTRYDKKLRKYLFWQNSVSELCNVYNVFANATVDTLLLLTSKQSRNQFPKRVDIKSIDRGLKSISERLSAVGTDDFSYRRVCFIHENDDDVAISFSNQLELRSEEILGSHFHFKKGMQPYELGKGTPRQTRQMMDDRIYDSTKRIDRTYLPLLKARDVKRYHVVWGKNYIKYGSHLAAPRDLEIFKGRRIIVQRIVSGTRLLATYLDSEFICNTDVITLKPRDNELEREQILFVLGVISSSAVASYVKARNVNLDRAAFPKINMETLSTLPIPSLDRKDPTHKSRHDKMVQLVEQMLSLHKKLPIAKTEQEKTVIQRQIEATDKQIETLVYELYGLTEEEIKIVEGKP